MDRLLLLFVAAILTLASCGERSPGGRIPSPDVDFEEAQLRGLGLEIEAEFNAGQHELFDEVFDLGELFKRMIWPTTPSKSQVAEFIEGTREQGGSLGSSLAARIISTGNLTLLHARKNEHGTALLYRLFSSGEEGGFDYIEFLVGKNEEGEPVLVDMYTTSNGEYVSQLLRRVYASSGSGVLGKLVDLVKSGETEKIVSAHEEMMIRARSGEHQQVLDYYNTLPAEIREQKIIQLRRIDAAAMLENDSIYEVAIQDFRKVAPDDPALAFKQIDYYIIREEYDSVQVVLNQLDERVDDPWLDYQRAEIAVLQEQYSKAVEYSERLIQRDSTLLEPYYMLIAIALRQDDYPGVNQGLERIRASGLASIDFEGIEDSENYDGYRASKEYRELRRKYAGVPARVAE